MPLLFSLAIHNASAEVTAQLFQGEYLFAYLDDIFVLAKPNRAFARFTICWARGCSQVLGSNSIQGRPEHGTAGAPPPSMGELGPDVWICSGIQNLGTVGDAEFVRRLSEERIGKLEQLWGAIAWVPDLQCAWQILLPCAGRSENNAAQSVSLVCQTPR